MRVVSHEDRGSERGKIRLSRLGRPLHVVAAGLALGGLLARSWSCRSGGRVDPATTLIQGDRARVEVSRQALRFDLIGAAEAIRAQRACLADTR